MNPVTLLIPAIFMVTFFVTIGGMPMLIKSVGEMAGNHVASAATPEESSDIEEQFLAEVAAASSKFDGQKAYELAERNFQNASKNVVINESNYSKKVVIAFDDGWKSQYLYAKPILDNFGFKATFFITCNFINGEGRGPYMTWKQVEEMHDAGYDIQSHSMSHRDLTKLSAQEIEYELAESKQCLSNHGINATVFATPFNSGREDLRVIDAIARHYQMAKNGNDSIMYLRCDGWGSKFTNQTDCRTYQDEQSKKLSFASRYAMMAENHNYYDGMYGQNQTKIFELFVQAVNRPYFTSQSGGPDSIVLLEYHRLNEPSLLQTDPALFYAEMKYLQENGFVVLTMSDLGYDEARNQLFVKRERMDISGK